ncbi:MAG TPA: hypothetical protein VH479_03790 [Acidimicrobiales bacterium]
MSQLERLVVVPVGTLDGRTTAALDTARRTPAGRHVALHVAADDRSAQAVGLAWMAAEHPEPLVIVDHPDVATGVAGYVWSQLLQDTSDVVVVAGRMLPATSWHRLRHDGTAEGIATRLDGDPRIVTVLVPVPAHQARSST